MSTDYNTPTKPALASSLEERLGVIQSIKLDSGGHPVPKHLGDLSRGACAMEAVSFLAGEDWTATPDCVCPTLSSFVVFWNDALRNPERTKLLLPLLPQLVDTRGSSSVRNRRSLLATDWLVRFYVPMLLQTEPLTYNMSKEFAELAPITPLSTEQQPPFYQRLDELEPFLRTKLDQLVEAERHLDRVSARNTRSGLPATTARVISGRYVKTFNDKTGATPALKAAQQFSGVNGPSDGLVFETLIVATNVAVISAFTEAQARYPDRPVDTELTARRLQHTKKKLKHSALQLLQDMIAVKEE